MFSTVLSASLQGMQAEFIHVEADVGNGLPFFHMVGHLASEVKESAERVRTAVKNSGIQIPPRKVVINLSPANVRKRGATFDLPIAAAVLAANGVISQETLVNVLIIGELWWCEKSSRDSPNSSGSKRTWMRPLHDSKGE